MQPSGHAFEEAGYLNFDSSYAREMGTDTRYIKMKGRKIYQFSLNKLPLAIQICFNNENILIEAIKKNSDPPS